MIKNSDLMNYLSQFTDDSELKVVVANPDKNVREIYPVTDFFLMESEDDRNFPCFIIGVGKAEPLKDD